MKRNKLKMFYTMVGFVITYCSFLRSKNKGTLKKLKEETRVENLKEALKKGDEVSKWWLVDHFNVYWRLVLVVSFGIYWLFWPWLAMIEAIDSIRDN